MIPLNNFFSLAERPRMCDVYCICICTNQILCQLQTYKRRYFHFQSLNSTVITFVCLFVVIKIPLEKKKNCSDLFLLSREAGKKLLVFMKCQKSLLERFSILKLLKDLRLTISWLFNRCFVLPNDGLFKVRNECYDVQMGQNWAREEKRLLYR